MTIEQFHTGFKLELDKSNSLEYVSFLPEEIDYWLNQAQIRWVKTRYTGNNPSRMAFEQDEKRIDDLRNLIVESQILTTDGAIKPNSFNAVLPDNYWFNLSDECEIAFIYPGYSTDILTGTNTLIVGNAYLVNGTITHNGVVFTDGTTFIAVNTNFTGSGTVTKLFQKRQGITETTTDRYRDAIDNNFSNHLLHYYHARPLLLYYDGDVELISDGNYWVRKYFLRYLRKPDVLSNYTLSVDNIDVGIVHKVSGGSVIYNPSAVPVIYGDPLVQLSNLSLSGVSSSNTNAHTLYWKLQGYASSAFIQGDTSNQLSNLSLAGLKSINTDDFKLYWILTQSQGPSYSLSLYKDSGMTSIVAGGTILSSPGTMSITEAYSSGISGSVDIAFTGADTDLGNIITFINVKLYKDSAKTSLVSSAFYGSEALTAVSLSFVSENGSGLTGSASINYQADDVDSVNTITVNGGIYTSGAYFTGVTGVTTFTKIDPLALVYVKHECELPDHSHNEILKLAVNMVLENLGDAQRYQTNSIEVQNME